MCFFCNRCNGPGRFPWQRWKQRLHKRHSESCHSLRAIHQLYVSTKREAGGSRWLDTSKQFQFHVLSFLVGGGGGGEVGGQMKSSQLSAPCRDGGTRWLGACYKSWSMNYMYVHGLNFMRIGLIYNVHVAILLNRKSEVWKELTSTEFKMAIKRRPG